MIYIKITFLFITTIFLLYILILSFVSLIPFRKKSLTNTKFKPLDVIIPAFNEERVISKCINSVINQKGNIVRRIFLVIDNCTDRTLNICTKYVKKNINIRIIKRENGVPSKINSILEALNLVKGDFFVILDADIILDKNAILMVYKSLIQNKAHFATSLVGLYKTDNIICKIMGWDRLFRQRIIQRGRSFFLYE